MSEKRAANRHEMSREIEILRSPQRIQRSRRKGYRLPESAVCVSRGTKWGNPFKLMGDMIYCDASHRRKILSPWVLWDDKLYTKEVGTREVVRLFKRWVYRDLPEGIVRPCEFTVDDIRRELSGKDLACWCGVDSPCHGDLLLWLANEW